MKPFDLEAALNGAKVITKRGEQVTQLVKFDTVYGPCLCGVIDGDGYVYRWTEQGKDDNPMEEDLDLDLFMAPNAKSIWVARFGDGQCVLHGFSTLEQCQLAHPDADGYHKIEWEE